MIYLLIVFVIALALAPLVHFVPSKRQREQARLREYAAVHGLFVEFRQLPETGRAAAARQSGRIGDTIYYGKRLTPRQAGSVQAGAWRRDAQGWRSVRGGATVPAALEQLPPAILAASADGHSCGVYWREVGGAETVHQIVQVLDAWSGP
ncbi:MAG: hypothetical protein KDI16_07425 [Halioglobus sp.]|nr:hypothetical protein [Halioglobus sp.]